MAASPSVSRRVSQASMSSPRETMMSMYVSTLELSIFAMEAKTMISFSLRSLTLVIRFASHMRHESCRCDIELRMRIRWNRFRGERLRSEESG